MADLAIIAALAFATGITSKFADLINEHGISWFKHSSQILGLIWGTLALALTLSDPYAAVVWIATVAYWFLVCKLDNFNHAFAGVCVVLAGIYMYGQGGVSLPLTIGLLVWLTASGYANTYLKRRHRDNVLLQRFLRLRMRYYIGPVVLGAAMGTWVPVVVIAAGMAGTELVTIWHARLERRRMPAHLVAGIRFIPAPDQPEALEAQRV